MMTKKLATFAMMLATTAPAVGQLSPARPISTTGRPAPAIAPEVLKNYADAKLRKDLDTAISQIEQLKTTITKMQQQLESTTNTAFTAAYNLDLVAKSYKVHSHLVNGVVGSGLTTTIDGNKQAFRYVTPPYSGQTGVELRKTGGPIQP